LKFKQYKYYTETRVTDQPNKKIKIDYVIILESRKKMELSMTMNLVKYADA